MSNNTPIKRKIISRKRPCSTPRKRDKVVKYDVGHSNVDSCDIQDLWNDSSFLTEDDLLKITDQTPAKVTALQQKQELIEVQYYGIIIILLISLIILHILLTIYCYSLNVYNLLDHNVI